ncbi:hypothetical protein BC939DRAFT_462719 [Gamsiella multidivaricata]|uniref:uncharacterized protein n=1 Tax=Gamsiella multidivaricata TaxID=101098 RepID=UPI00221EE795|nr:uncharacterized protein BC939DRAFT_462719 [Gamsiella multidivaricata]KAI7818520.1 hypothetical protein BC939DRAFT_462719 [Gamsiella multidivaricata]
MNWPTSLALLVLLNVYAMAPVSLSSSVYSMGLVWRSQAVTFDCKVRSSTIAPLTTGRRTSVYEVPDPGERL